MKVIPETISKIARNINRIAMVFRVLLFQSGRLAGICNTGMPCNAISRFNGHFVGFHTFAKSEHAKTWDLKFGLDIHKAYSNGLGEPTMTRENKRIVLP